MHDLSNFLCPRQPLWFGHLLHFQGKADVLQHAHVWVKRIILKNQANPSPFWCHLSHINIVKKDAPFSNR